MAEISAAMIKDLRDRTGSGMAVAIGSGNLIPGFEDQLVGVKVGEE